MRQRQIILVLALFFVVVLAGEDYYKNLGISRNADQSQIKKAFKKLSLKYHPDKNKSDPKLAEQQFQKIVQAYEVLKDPKQKDIYDKYGEEGLKQNQQQGGGGGGHFHGGNFQDIFSQFFGQQQHGGHHHQHQQQGGANLFNQSDVYELDMGSLSTFLRRQEVWVILFYKSNQQQSHQLKDSYRDLASKYYGILKVAAIDCAEEDALCEDEFQTYDSPSIQVFESNIRVEGHKYVGNLSDSQKIANFAVKFMESYVRNVSAVNYAEFTEENAEKNKIILFTQKKSTPPLFRALSKEYNSKLVFGEIRDTERDLIQKFKITSFPTLLVITDPQTYQGIKYEGAFKKDQIQKFLREYSYVKSAGSSRSPTPSQVKLLSPEIVNNPIYCGSSDTKLCFLIVTDNDSISAEEAITTLKQLAIKYADSKIKFYHIPRRLIELENIFDTEDFDILPAALVIKGKRNRFAHYPANQPISLSSLEIFLDDIIAGGGSFKAMHDHLKGNVFSDRSDL